jgi:hypothetical protein
MSSRESHRAQAGPERDPHHRYTRIIYLCVCPCSDTFFFSVCRSRDYHHQRQYGSRAGYNNYDAYDEAAEPGLASAFEDLELNNGRTQWHERPHAGDADASGSISSIHLDSPIHRPQEEDLRSPQHAEAGNPGFDPDNSLGLVSADSRNTSSSSPLRDIGLNSDHRAGSPPTSDSEDFEDPLTYSPWRHLRSSSWRNPAFAQIPGYPQVYPNDGLFVQRAEAALECHCHTCVEHRRDIRRWALPLYQGRTGSSVSDYFRGAYPSSSSQRGYYWPSQARTDWFHPNEEYFSDCESEPSSYGSWVEDVYPDHGLSSHSPRPNPRPTEWEDSYYESYYESDMFEGDLESVGSDHERSDSASYTGYERYDGYGSGYYDDDYDDGDFSD